MWLEQAKLHAISGNTPWATLSLIYSCLSKLLRLQSYRSSPFKSDISVTEYFLWALKVCSWSRKCVTATESTIYGWILNVSKQFRHPTCKYNWSISLRYSADGLLHTFAFKQCSTTLQPDLNPTRFISRVFPCTKHADIDILESMQQAAQQSLFFGAGSYHSFLFSWHSRKKTPPEKKYPLLHFNVALGIMET